MPRYKLTVAYDGTNFHGWQKQQSSTVSDEPVAAEPTPEIRTVQGVLEQAIRETVREPVRILGASRTDARVHALGQVAAFTTTREIPVDRLPQAISSRLPEDVQVRAAEIVSESFSPISDCIAKGYRYRIAHDVLQRRQQPLFDRHFTFWTPYELDVVTMNDAARRLIGEHDFASFTRVAHGRDSTIRTVFNCQVEQQKAGHCYIDISGNGFLYNMVRIIAGTLVDVGRGQIEPERIAEILNANDRAAAGPTLPPEGLCLRWIKYRT